MIRAEVQERCCGGYPPNAVDPTGEVTLFYSCFIFIELFFFLMTEVDPLSKRFVLNEKEMGRLISPM